MAEESAQTVLSVLFSHILPLVPGMSERLDEGASLLDLGCGRGRALLMLAEHFPRSRFWATTCRRTRSRMQLRRRRSAGSTMSASNSATSAPSTWTWSRRRSRSSRPSTVHDQARPLALLRGIRRSLARRRLSHAGHPGSSHVHENIDHPGGPLLYMISCMHCMTVSLAQGGDGLGAMWGEQRGARAPCRGFHRSRCICSSTIRSTRTSSCGPDFDTTRPELRGTFDGRVDALARFSGRCRCSSAEGTRSTPQSRPAFVLQVVEPHLNGPGGEVPAVWSVERGEPLALCGQGSHPPRRRSNGSASSATSLVPWTGVLAAACLGRSAAGCSCSASSARGASPTSSSSRSATPSTAIRRMTARNDRAERGALALVAGRASTSPFPRPGRSS